MAVFDGHMGQPARGNDLSIICQRYLAEAIREHDSKAVVAEQDIIVTRGPYEDQETYSLLQDGTLAHPKPEVDPGRGMSRLKRVWKVQGRINEKPGVYPAYEAELLIAEYGRHLGYIPLGKRAGQKWVSPVGE